MKESRDRSVVISTVPYWKLVPMVGVENQHTYERVLDSVGSKGILYPLIVVKISKDAWEYEKATSNPDMLDPPDYLDNTKIYRIQCGNNRYRAGLELGFDTFPCIVLDNLQEAKEMCCKQRKGDKEW